MNYELCTVVGVTGGAAMIELKDGALSMIPGSELGGDKKDKKAENMLGAVIEVIKKDDKYSRKMALAERAKGLKRYKIGDIVKIRPVVIFEGFAVFDGIGHEIFMKTHDITVYYTNDLKDLLEYGQEYDAKIMSLEPLKMSMKDATARIDVSKYENHRQWLGEVTGNTKIGIFCKVPGGGQVLCYKSEWARQPRPGDKVSLEITKIKVSEGLMWGHIKKFISKARG